MTADLLLRSLKAKDPEVLIAHHAALLFVLSETLPTPELERLLDRASQRLDWAYLQLAITPEPERPDPDRTP